MVPPRAGPTIKPIPTATPISPKFLARFLGSVMSAIEACAILIFAPAKPAIARDMKSIEREERRIPSPKKI